MEAGWGERGNENRFPPPLQVPDRLSLGAAAEQAAVPDKVEPPVKKRRGRKPATVLAATEECPLPPAPPVEQCPMPTPKPA